MKGIRPVERTLCFACPGPRQRQKLSTFEEGGLVTIDQQRRLRPTAAADETTWRDQASCRQLDPGVFFPAGDLVAQEIEDAKAICESCPVQSDCLQFALENKQEDGIWGGTDEVERRRLRRVWLAGRRLRAG